MGTFNKPPEELVKYVTPSQAKPRSKYNREKPACDELPLGLTRIEAKEQVERRLGKSVRNFIYDARTGWASWL